MPEILWWFLIGFLQILSLMLIPAIPVVVWVLWEWYRQETEGLSVADWRDQAACSRCYQKAKYKRRKRAHS